MQGTGGASATHRAFLRTASGQRIELMPNRIYVLGRDEMCDLQIDDPVCSRRHAKIIVAGDSRKVYLEDLRSKNGTFWNDAKLDKRVQLGSGDTVRLGSTVYEFFLWEAELEGGLDTRTTMYRG